SAACAAFVSPEKNPGVGLGLALGTLARGGRDKLTLSLSDEIALFSDWIEQLVAESTGKHGKGVVPIAGEPLDEPDRYGSDRVFVDLALAGDPGQAEREARLAALEAAGHPIIRITLTERLDLLQEVFRWEVATAVIGALHDLNPFDQPDVESAKVASRALMEEARSGDALPVPAPRFRDEGAAWIVSPAVGNVEDAASAIAALLGGLGEHDTFFVNAFLEDTPATRTALQALREEVGRARRVATTLDFGPRYLHSTGQLQKGGPNRLVGLQLWQSAGARKGAALEIPGMGGDFDTLAEAQAAGDYSVLAERERRVIGIDVGADPVATLERLARLVAEALA
ncbi:MAG: transaldolase, partial [Myxococcota bacterium]